MKSIRFTLGCCCLPRLAPASSFAFGSVSLSLTPSRKERSGGSGISGAPLQLLAARSGHKFESVGAIAALD